MVPDISKLTEKELLKLQKSVEKSLTRIRNSKKAEARKAAEAAARKLGFSLNELVSAPAKSRNPKIEKKPAAKAKYRNPKNASETWSGRGRQPFWYKEALSKGVDPKKMEI